MASLSSATVQLHHNRLIDGWEGSALIGGEAPVRGVAGLGLVVAGLGALVAIGTGLMIGLARDAGRDGAAHSPEMARP